MSKIEILKEAIELLKATKGNGNTAQYLKELYDQIKKLADAK